MHRVLSELPKYHYEHQMRKKIVSSLFALNETSPEAVAANYYGWEPAQSYLKVRTLQVST